MPDRGCTERTGRAADAVVLLAAGRYGDALSLIDHALASRPHDGEIRFARASLLFTWGRHREALAEYQRALATGLKHPDLQQQLGWSYFYAGRLGDAERSMREAVRMEPDSRGGHFGLGAVYQAQKRSDDAVAEFERALELQRGDFDCYIRLGNCSLDRRDPLTAEGYFRCAISGGGDRSAAWDDLGVALEHQDRYEEALNAFRRAAALGEGGGAEGDSFFNLAVMLGQSGQLEEGLHLYEANLNERPSLPGYYAYGMALLTAGRLREGWNALEFRWLSEPCLSLRPGFQRPLWNGEDLQGKTILLVAEQGLGDTIQFLRYAPYVKAAGATVLLRVPDALQRLVKGAPGIDRVLLPGGGDETFDTYIHLQSLPRVFGTDLTSIPAETPYLFIPPEDVDRWAERLSGPGVKIGLVWAGNPAHLRDRFRSLALSELRPILRVEGARFFLLQKGPAAAEAATLPADLEVENLGAELNDIADTAAVISQLDLVICVDTAIAHLAGALAKPVWLMLPKPADWRWLEQREDSPWYPTSRLFRQSVRGNWSDVVASIARELADLVRGGHRRPVVSTKPPGRPPVPRRPALSRLTVEHRPGSSAVAECRYGILQYLPDQPLVGDSLEWYGEYLQHQLNLLLRLVRPGATALEVGAGVGAHSLPLAAALGQQGHLLLHESRPAAQRILRQNLKANRAGNTTQLRRALRTRQDRSPSEDSGSRASAPGSSNRLDDTLDDLRLEALQILKVSESSIETLGILEGAQETLWRLRPLLFIATESGAALQKLVLLGKDYGYRCWRKETPLFNPGNFNRRPDDIFLGATAVSLLAIPEEIEVDIPLDGCVELS